MSLFTDIKTLLDEPGTGVFWTDADVYDAANEAALEVWASTKWQVTTATLTCTTSADLVALPCEIFIPQYYLGTYGKQFITSHAQAENWSREWKLAAPAYPRHLVIWDAEHLRPIPKPDATYTFTLVGLSWPTEISASNLDLTAAANLKHAIMLRAASELLEHTLPDLADTMYNESIEAELAFKEQLRNQQSHNIRRLKPGSLFQRAQGGSIRLGQKLR
jgi:hypothetical protein